MKKLFFDCETGGMDPRVHSLLTVYFGVYDDNLELIDELDLQLKPDNLEDLRVQQAALDITGINLEDHIKNERTITFSQAKKELISFLNKHKIKGKILRTSTAIPYGEEIA